MLLCSFINFTKKIFTKKLILICGKEMFKMQNVAFLLNMQITRTLDVEKTGKESRKRREKKISRKEKKRRVRETRKNMEGKKM